MVFNSDALRRRKHGGGYAFFDPQIPTPNYQNHRRTPYETGVDPRAGGVARGAGVAGHRGRDDAEVQHEFVSPGVFRRDGVNRYYPSDPDDFSTIATESQVIDMNVITRDGDAGYRSEYPPPPTGTPGKGMHGTFGWGDNDRTGIGRDNSRFPTSPAPVKSPRRTKYIPQVPSLQEDGVFGGVINPATWDASSADDKSDASFVDKLRDTFLTACSSTGSWSDRICATDRSAMRLGAAKENPRGYQEQRMDVPTVPTERRRKFARQTDRHGNMYEGQFLGGKRDGHGIILYAATKDRYEGQWYDNEPHGMGRLTRGDGFGEFEGRWDLGQLQEVKEGFAHVVDEDGTTYAGDFFNWKKHGNGTMITAHGEKYRGQWAHGVKDGLGISLYPDGNVFQGIFENDRPMVPTDEAGNAYDAPMLEMRGGRKLWKRKKKRNDMYSPVVPESPNRRELERVQQQDKRQFAEASKARTKEIMAQNRTIEKLKRAQMEKQMKLNMVQEERMKLEQSRAEHARMLELQAYEHETAQQLLEEKKAAAKRQKALLKQQEAFKAKTKQMAKTRSRMKARESTVATKTTYNIASPQVPEGLLSKVDEYEDVSLRKALESAAAAKAANSLSSANVSGRVSSKGGGSAPTKVGMYNLSSNGLSSKVGGSDASPKVSFGLYELSSKAGEYEASSKVEAEAYGTPSKRGVPFVPTPTADHVPQKEGLSLALPPLAPPTPVAGDDEIELVRNE